MSQELEEAKELIDQHLDENLEDGELSAYELAQHLKTLKKHDEELFAKYLEKLDPEILGDVAIELPDHMLKDVIDTLPAEKIVEALEELESDDATDLLQYIEDIDEDKARELFNELDKENQNEILRLRSYDEDRAGAHMQTELFSAHLEEKLGSAVARLRQEKQEGKLENVSQLFIIDKNSVLQYAIPLEDLILFDFTKTLKQNIESTQIDHYKPHMANDMDLMQDVADMFQEYDLNVIAVTSSTGILLGRITYDDIHDYIQESATEQIYNLAGVDDESEEDDTLFKAGRGRAVWLGINLLTALFSSSIIGLFDETIAAYVALAVLMPIVASMGGNTGTQALAVTVRRLALGEIEFKDAKSVLKREVTISLVNGLIFGAIMGVIAAVWFDKGMLGVVIGLSMVTNLFFAGFFGTIIPLTLRRFNIDPAVGSAVILTTFTDAIGFFSFLGLAKWILL
ncbi:magnesium transporter [Campylobacter sp. 10_1_50]|uniref:Magnesium transporter MgtE n=2 Tax=Campylobacter concisus TaxID=199 RepID=A0A1Y5N8Z6_9BACT|nr:MULTISPECIES: magnesium transporter [Campylobacter]EHL91285.1 magnesium transporter [Campylobacter sp. 10_1_50]ERJ24504.1 Magnesium transporter [Campylobacter concisus UNSW1]ERJ31309.1 Magnesium transporter [Campylobacter concisus UNSW2]MCA6131085.1 magnesium transporter [Campylobacter concisus]MCA6132649.1 magnesium transporter [Campylobacter concisus]